MDQAQLYNSLNTIYDPQRQSIVTQQAALPTMFNAQRTGLEQARANAFRDISSKARGMGVAFGGYSPSEQARYTGATYIPALGNINNAQTTANQALIDALNGVNAEQSSKTLGLYQTELERQQAQKQWEQELAEKQRQFNAELLTSSSGGASYNSQNPSPYTIMDNYNKTFQAGKIGGRKVATKGEELVKPEAYISRESFIRALASQYPELDPQTIVDDVYATYRG